MNHYWMKLQDDFFRALTTGNKRIEVRLYDSKRRKLNKGDIITFSHAETGKSIELQVADLYIYPSFRSLFKKFPPEDFGFPLATSIETMLETMYKIYKPWDEVQNGVVGIRLQQPADVKED